MEGQPQNWDAHQTEAERRLKLFKDSARLKVKDEKWLRRGHIIGRNVSGSGSGSSSSSRGFGWLKHYAIYIKYCEETDRHVIIEKLQPEEIHTICRDTNTWKKSLGPTVVQTNVRFSRLKDCYEALRDCQFSATADLAEFIQKNNIETQSSPAVHKPGCRGCSRGPLH